MVVAKKSSEQITQRYFPIGSDAAGALAARSVGAGSFTDSDIRKVPADLRKYYPEPTYGAKFKSDCDFFAPSGSSLPFRTQVLKPS
jgi:hypothetical protein